CSGAFLLLCAWTKNEGLLPLCALPAALALQRRARLRELLFIALGALPVLALLACFKLRIALSGDLLAGRLLERALDPLCWATLLFASARRLVYFQLWALHLVTAAVFALCL